MNMKPIVLLAALLLLLGACAPAPAVAPAGPTAAAAATTTPVPPAAEPTEAPTEAAPTDAPTETTEPPTEAPTETAVPPTQTSVPSTGTPAPVADPEPEPVADPEPAPGTGDPVRGQQVYSALPCAGCHGPNAQGDFGPKIAGTELSFEDVHKQVREGEEPMPAFPPEQVSDQQIRDIYAWLQSLE